MRAASATVGHEHRPVCLHHREDKGGADTEQKHAVGSLQRAHHLPVRLEHSPEAPRVVIESTE